MVLLIIIPMKNGYFIGNIPYYYPNYIPNKNHYYWFCWSLSLLLNHWVFRGTQHFQVQTHINRFGPSQCCRQHFQTSGVRGYSHCSWTAVGTQVRKRQDSIWYYNTYYILYYISMYIILYYIILYYIILYYTIFADFLQVLFFVRIRSYGVRLDAQLWCEDLLGCAPRNHSD